MLARIAECCFFLYRGFLPLAIPGQGFFQAFNIALAPQAHAHPARHGFWRSENVANLDIAGQTRGSEAQFFAT